MNAAQSLLQNAIEVMETNEPINRAEGHIAQADLEADNAQEYRDALATLQAAA